MKPFSEVLEEYLSELVSELRRTNNDDVIGDVAEDLHMNFMFRSLMKQLVIYCLKNDLLINSFSVLKFLPRDKVTIAFGKASEEKEYEKNDYIPFYRREKEQISENVYIIKGVLYLMLERMGLEKSKEFLKKKEIIEGRYGDGGKVLNASEYYSKEEINSFNTDDFEIILKKELEEEYEDEPIIIEYKN